MKRIYDKPELKTVKLMASESLLTASLTSLNWGGSDETKTINGGINGGMLSNQESEHDIWGNSGNSIW